jgi:hypothetical protein
MAWVPKGAHAIFFCIVVPRINAKTLGNGNNAETQSHKDAKREEFFLAQRAQRTQRRLRLNRK